MRSARSILEPWRGDVSEGGYYFPICYVCARVDEALHSIYMTPAEDVVIAEAIAKLPGLPTTPQP